MSGCEVSRYGCAYDRDVGLRMLDVARDSNIDRAVNVVDAEAMRDSSTRPSRSSRISCKPTDHFKFQVGIAYAIDATMLVFDALIERDSGGYAECDFKDDRSIGGLLEISGIFSDSPSK